MVGGGEEMGEGDALALINKMLNENF
jgi:hypothetical protein